jgi:hypothetical protein
MSMMINPFMFKAPGNTLTAEPGTFTVTGNDVTFKRSLRMSAAPGVFALTGNDANLLKGVTMPAATGAFALTGNDVSFKRSLRMSAATGTFTLTGNAATLTYNQNERLTFVSSGNVYTAATTKTFSGLSLGAEDANRVILLSLTMTRPSSQSATVNSVTIGGVTATRVLRVIEAGSSGNAEIWYAAVPTGTTGDVVVGVSTSASTVAVSVALYRITDLASTTPTDTGVSDTGATVAIDVAAGGVILAVGAQRDSASLSLSNVDLDYDVSAGTGHRGVHSSKESASAQTINIAFTGSATAPRLAVAAFN